MHLELTGDTEPANLVLQRAPAGAWTIETTVRVPLSSGSQQAGLIAYRDDGDHVKLVAAAAGGRVRLRLVSEAGNAVARNSPSTVAPRPRSDTYRLRLSRSGSRYTGWWSVNGVSWRRLGTVVNGRLAAQPAYGLVALGPGTEGAPPYASFAGFRASRKAG